MGKKEEDIADRIESCLDLMVFDNVIDVEEKQELSRKLGVIWELPDMLAYFDLREIAISALVVLYPLADAVREKQQEMPDTEGKTLDLTTHPSTETPTHGETNAQGVDTSGEAWFTAPPGHDEPDQS